MLVKTRRQTGINLDNVFIKPVHFMKKFFVRKHIPFRKHEQTVIIKNRTAEHILMAVRQFGYYVIEIIEAVFIQFLMQGSAVIETDGLIRITEEIPVGG